MNNLNCWNASNESACSSLTNCAWQNNSWSGASTGSGWCNYAPMTSCMNLSSSSGCNANSNCSWRTDNYSMTGGWCDLKCMDQTLNQASCEAVGSGLCQWKNMNATCQPSTFMLMAKSGGGGKMGCGQNGGNMTGCLINNATCTYKNDSYARNNLSNTEPAGWCMDKSEFEQFGESESNIIDLAADSGNINGSAESGVQAQVDLLGMGMRVSSFGIDFGARVFNISQGIMCNGYAISVHDSFGGQAPSQGNGNKTTRFFWYLDTDGSSSNGCVAVSASGGNLTGYDLMISYVSRNDSTNGFTETKQIFRCSSGSWTPTNAMVTTSKKISCGDIGGVMVAVSKQDLESFSEYNKTANMRVFMSSANKTASRLSPQDSVGPGYYTPGTIDFGFVDCSDPSNSQNAKCKNFQKFGFNVFEECKNGVDDDENGLVDCSDPF